MPATTPTVTPTSSPSKPPKVNSLKKNKPHALTFTTSPVQHETYFATNPDKTKLPKQKNGSTNSILKIENSFYEIIDKLDKGCFAKVLKAQNLTTKELVAIKVIYANDKTKEEYLPEQAALTILGLLKGTLIRYYRIEHNDTFSEEQNPDGGEQEQSTRKSRITRPSRIKNLSNHFNLLNNDSIDTTDFADPDLEKISSLAISSPFETLDKPVNSKEQLFSDPKQNENLKNLYWKKKRTDPIGMAKQPNRKIYLVMPLHEGPTLKKFCETKQELKEIDLINLILEIIKKIQLNHEIGVIHNDLSRNNIIITKEGPEIIDYGLAVRLNGESLIAPIFKDAGKNSPILASEEEFDNAASSSTTAAPEYNSRNAQLILGSKFQATQDHEGKLLGFCSTASDVYGLGTTIKIMNTEYNYNYYTLNELVDKMTKLHPDKRISLLQAKKICENFIASYQENHASYSNKPSF